MKFKNKIAFYGQEIRVTWRTLKTNWLINLTEKVVFILTLIALIILAFNYRFLPPQVPLWYSRPWGAERLASSLWLLIFPVGNIFWFLVNIVVATFTTRDYPIFTRVLFLTSLLVSFLSTIAITQIILLVT
ncbi:MAG: hypothetical protein ACOY0S_00785 [Patescibacteria group bacterium]